MSFEAPDEVPTSLRAAKPFLGVALSGGGTRAALLSLGALMAVAEHVADRKVEVEVSAVSGGALAAIETALSVGADDITAVQNAARRVVRYGYWPSRWWFIGSGILIAGALTWYLDRDFWDKSNVLSSVGTLIVIALFVIGVVSALVVAAMRSAPLWLRGFEWSHGRKVSLSARRVLDVPGESYPTVGARALVLEIMRINVTDVTRGRHRVVDGSAMRSLKETPLGVAQASASFPGAFTPGPINGLGAELYADGGIWDNTGLAYFHDMLRNDAHYISVDASLPEKIDHSGAHRAPYDRVPHAWLIDASIGAFVGSLLVLLAGEESSGSPGSITSFPTGPIVAAGYGVLISLMNFGPATFLRGLFDDMSWVGRGWPVSVRSSSITRRQHFASACAGTMSRFDTVTLNAQACLGCPGEFSHKLMPTTLGAMRPQVAAQIVEHSYALTCTILGLSQSAASRKYLKDLGATGAHP